jgi:hypothetical protein
VVEGRDGEKMMVRRRVGKMAVEAMVVAAREKMVPPPPVG